VESQPDRLLCDATEWLAMESARFRLLADASSSANSQSLRYDNFAECTCTRRACYDRFSLTFKQVMYPQFRQGDQILPFAGAAPGFFGQEGSGRMAAGVGRELGSIEGACGGVFLLSRGGPRYRTCSLSPDIF